MTNDIPFDHLGQPDLQALVQQRGGYDEITPELWTEWDRANAEWQVRRRQAYGPPVQPKSARNLRSTR